MRPFGPKSATHPSIGKECPACNVAFIEGDFTTLVTLGPGDDSEAQRKAREGRAYNAVATEVHWLCVTGEEPLPVGECTECGGRLFSFLDNTRELGHDVSCPVVTD